MTMDASEDNKNFDMAFWVSILFMVVALVLIGQGIFYPKHIKNMVAHGSYWVITFLVGVWLLLTFKSLLVEPIELHLKDKAFWVGVIVCVGLTGMVYVGVENTFRVLSDETNLLAISKSLHVEKTIYNSTMGTWYYDSFHPILREFPKRPILFPYLTHVLHVLVGYSPYNSFLLNSLCLSALLLSVFLMVLRRSNIFLGLLAVLLCFSQPILSLSASSGGYDLCSMLFFFFMLWGALRQMEYGTPLNGAWFWTTGVMFSYVRYESFAFFAFAFVVLTVTRHLRWDQIKAYLPIYAATPLWSLPYIGQRLSTVGKYENPDDVSLFSVTRFVEHLEFMGKGLINFDFSLPYNTVLNLVGLVCGLVLLVLWFLRKGPFQSRPAALFGFLCGGCFAMQQVIFLSHHMGLYHHPTQTRFFLGFCIAMALAPVCALCYASRRVLHASVCAGVLMVALYFPVAQEDALGKTLVLNRKTRLVHHFLSQSVPPGALIIVSRPGQYAVFNYGAVNFSHARKSKKTLLNSFRRHLYPDMIVVQEMEYESQEPLEKEVLPEDYGLETLKEIQFTAKRWVRISRVVIPEPHSPK